jgi:hypothetical protein
MNREKHLKVRFLMGSAISATTMGFYRKFCFTEDKTFVSFSATDEQILSGTETNIPTTASSAGAKGWESSAFIPMIMRCYPANLQELFCKWIERDANQVFKDFNKDFYQSQKDERNQLMSSLRDDAIATNKAPSFSYCEICILGYYTSEMDVRNS